MASGHLDGYVPIALFKEHNPDINWKGESLNGAQTIGRPIVSEARVA